MSRPYSVYKETGLDWLGQVPAHWETTKAKWLFANVSEKNCPDEQLLSATQEYGVVPRDMLEERVVMPMGELVHFKLVQQGDFVISLRSFQGGIEYSDYRGLVSPAYTVLRNKKTINKTYFKYLMKCFPFISELQTSVTGIREGKNINYKDFAEIIIPIPPLSEQTKIAQYIEEQTAVINQFLSNKRRLIELLEEQKQVVINTAVTQGLDTAVPRKPSGIEWLGKIPAHWDVKKLKYLVPGITVGIVVTPAKYYVDSGIPCLRSLNISKGYIDSSDLVYISSESNELHRKSKIYEGDLVIVRTGQAGVAVTVPPRFDGANCIDLLIVRKSDNLLPDFLYFFVNSSITKTQVDLNSVGAIQLHFNTSTLAELLVICPPIQEQAEIVGNIEQKTAEINVAIERTQREIELIEEYRTTLIAHAVTGKIDVREVVHQFEEP